MSEVFFEAKWCLNPTHGRIQDGCHHQVESEWMSEVFLCKYWENGCNPRWLNPTWQNSRWLPSSSWVRMNEFESDWISLSQSQNGVRVFLSEIWEKITMVSESKMAVSESNMAEFKMAAIIKLSQNEWVKVFFVQNGWIQNGRIQYQLPSSRWVRMNEWSFFVLNGWIHDGRVQDSCHHQVESEWMSEVFFVENGWIKNGRFQDSCHHQVESEWMSEVFLCKCWELILASVSGFERKN